LHELVHFRREFGRGCGLFPELVERPFEVSFQDRLEQIIDAVHFESADGIFAVRSGENDRAFQVVKVENVEADAVALAYGLYTHPKPDAQNLSFADQEYKPLIGGC
jgi:hypothetical protein